jgi:hypothetical protein
MLPIFSKVPVSSRSHRTYIFKCRVMESSAKSISTTKHPGDGTSSNSLLINISTWQLLDRLLFFIKPVIEYAFGMHIGFAFGWLVGLCAGQCYVKHFQPVYLDDLNQLSFWTTAPNMFARYGALTGLIIGVIAILIINSKLLNQKVAALYEKGITNPSQIARLLDSSTCKIKRKMNKLAKTGRINRKAGSP